MKEKWLSGLAVHELKIALGTREEQLMEALQSNPDAPQDVRAGWVESAREVRELNDFLCQPHQGTRLQLVEETAEDYAKLKRAGLRR